ncbi:MAG: DMT family transporter [Alphaproteobacteria bacterium]|nr:DMT family transporter [Alphaproteobacteria bacterium]
MPLWIVLTIVSAFLLNLRNTLQKQLTNELSAIAATYVRFSFGLPVAGLYLAWLTYWTGAALPTPDSEFFAYCLSGGMAQIMGTALTVALFAYRNFAIGSAYAKTETVQTALFGWLVLGDRLSSSSVAAIFISLIGVMLISATRSALTVKLYLSSLLERPALMGIGAGACFGISAVSYRAASLSLGRSDFLMPAAFTLLNVLIFQTIIMTAWLAWREPGQLTATARNWKVSALVGITGAVSSMGWFTAMTLEKAALVRALGQIELLFAIASSVFLFKEHIKRLELAGSGLVVGGILLLLLTR